MLGDGSRAAAAILGAPCARHAVRIAAAALAGGRALRHPLCQCAPGPSLMGESRWQSCLALHGCCCGCALEPAPAAALPPLVLPDPRPSNSARPLQNPATLRMFQAAAERVSGALRAFLPLMTGVSAVPSSGAAPPGVQHCYLVITTTHLALAFLLPARPSTYSSSSGGRGSCWRRWQRGGPTGCSCATWHRSWECRRMRCLHSARLTPWLPGCAVRRCCRWPWPACGWACCACGRHSIAALSSQGLRSSGSLPCEVNWDVRSAVAESGGGGLALQEDCHPQSLLKGSMSKAWQGSRRSSSTLERLASKQACTGLHGFAAMISAKASRDAVSSPFQQSGEAQRCC